MLEISGGEIALRREKPIQLPDPKEIGREMKEKITKVWNAFFSEKKEVKKKAKSLHSSIIALNKTGERFGFKWEDQRKEVTDLAKSFASLAEEKPDFGKKVLREILPPKRKGLSGLVSDLLYGQIPVNMSPEEKVGAILDKFRFSPSQKKAVRDLSLLFQKVAGGEEDKSEEKRLDWDWIIGRRQEKNDSGRQKKDKDGKKEKKETAKERAKRETMKATSQGYEISRRRGAWFWPTVGAIVVLSLWTYAEKDSPWELSPLSQVLEKPGVRNIPIVGRQPADERFFYGPEAQQVVENRPGFNIDNWLIDVYFQPQNRKNAQDPSKYDKRAKNLISALDKKFKGVEADKIAETAMASPFYKDYPEFSLSWRVAEEIIKAKRKGGKIDPEVIRDFRELFWEGKHSNILPPWED